MALQFGPEDQRNINTFSKLNTQLHELDAMITIQQVRRRSGTVGRPWRCMMPATVL